MSDTPDKPHTVFVSHAHADNELCDRYVDALRKRGLDVWYDRTNMQNGQFLSQEIENQLRVRTALVVLITPASLASYWVRLEVGAFQSLVAQDASRLFLPVRVAECDMPLLMMAIKWIDAVSLDFDATIEALVVALRAPALGVAAVPPASTPLVSANAVIAPAGHTPKLPTDPRVTDLIKQSRALFNKRKYIEALDTYEKALTIDPNNDDAWTGKGWTLYRLSRWDEALAAYDRALEIEPKNPSVWYGKGWALRWLGRVEEALGAYERALRLEPNNAQAWHDIGEALHELGRRKEADAADRRARELGWKG